ncbi:MtrAB system histidine kinase MtrB [Nakamurella aerolata]|uniref:Sensor histidine kinase MtrB n=1 Tax=Nakamurella aerolata TaxID=1656892 RepID=A0A849A9N3_9ACTN|nr:MtrAB system histidine kinase MtrB [Nakamurella aerolata]NNG36677.1 HAMP domain-containing histidine kinase [Nakamurella aerolata]
MTSAGPPPESAPDPAGTPAALPAWQRAIQQRALRRRAWLGRFADAIASAVRFWGRSLRLRVLVLTAVLSSLVVLGLGFVLQQQIVEGLLRSKIDAAVAETRNAAVRVGDQLATVDPDREALRLALNRAQQDIGQPTADPNSDAQTSAAGVFQPVIIATTTPDVDAGQVRYVPADLQASVSAGNVARQYISTTVGGVSRPALAVGAPVATSTEVFGVYLIFPLTSEQATVAVVQRTLLLGGLALALAMTVIATLVAFQVVRPVRQAARVAERVAAGALDERMPVRGAIELTTMARSFNGMAEAIRAQIRQLEEFGRLQRRFTSDVSHELRTPVTTVRMAADLLYADRDEFPPHLARATELLVDELDRFEGLLGDLLEISRHDAGMAELNAERIDIRTHVNASVEAMRPLADKAGVQVRIVAPDRPVVAEVDSRRLERILRNLVGNAIDHAEGQPVTVQVGQDDQAVAVTVTDTGVGLKPGEATLVFHRFWRADPSRQRQTGGTGLGLAISLEDARLHGGWLQAYGLAGVGARFRLTLPKEPGTLLPASPLPLDFSAPAADAKAAGRSLRGAGAAANGAQGPVNGAAASHVRPGGESGEDQQPAGLGRAAGTTLRGGADDAH